jgi:ribonuclease HI
VSAERAWAAEEALLREEIRRDPRALATLLAHDFHEIGQSGTHWNRPRIIDALVSEEIAHPLTITIDERRTDPLGDDFVLLTYRLDFDGRRSRRSSVWRVNGDEPVILFHQGTPID